MFENLPEYMKEVIYSTSKDVIPKEKFELYKEEMRIINNLKKNYPNEIKEFIERV